MALAFAKEVWPETLKEEDAEIGPATLRFEAMDEEPEEMKPARKEESEEKKELPWTERVEEAESGPATFRFAAMEEEAPEINPPVKVCKPDRTKPVIEAPPVIFKFVAIIVPVANSPPTVEVPETRVLPWTANTVEVAAEVVPIKKVPVVTKPPLLKVICVALALAKEV